MIYVGSKNRIANKILPFILENYQDYNNIIEPFCGGCNLTVKLPSDINKIANDYNPYLISLFNYFIDNKNIDFINISKEEYNNVKYNKSNYPDWYVGYVGFIYSFKGKFFDGYNGEYEKRNYPIEFFTNFKNQLKYLRDVKFHSMDYKELMIPSNSIIYCDPPYTERKYYSSLDLQENFNLTDFFQWCRDISVNNNKILISCYYGFPPDFKVLWSSNLQCHLSKNKTDNETQNKTEYLVTY